jgi:RimJ/RimL family protein N-acetyltransferase
VIGVAMDTGAITLHDGTEVGFRPIRATDDRALQRFHAGLSARSVYQRFFSLMPRLGAEQAHYFADANGIDRLALVALDPRDPREIIGVVRLERDRERSRAEYAAVIDDRWQGKGLGLALTRRLIALAVPLGITRFYAYVLPDNARMLSLLRDLRLPEHVHDEGGVEVVDVGPVEPGFAG